MKEWNSFVIDPQWSDNIDVKSFMRCNLTPYDGDDSFLEPPTGATLSLWRTLKEIGLDTKRTDTSKVGSIISHKEGYIDQALEKIVGLQSEKPLESTIIAQGGIRLVEKTLNSLGSDLPPEVRKAFTEYRKTHNDGVFDAYTEDILKARKSGIITGLPDAYGRGRIIGDYRRVPLYGVSILLKDKLSQKESISDVLTEETIRLREELSEQIKALKDLITLGNNYGFDLTRPANSAREAIQWLYFAYLAAVKQQNGAAMSLGRTSSFIDIYIERDIRSGILSEIEAQELIDQFIMKLRIVRFLRAPEYDELFSGDPVWITESLGGMTSEGGHQVTKTSFRYLHTLYNLGASPEPNLTVLWDDNLPRPWKEFCAKVSIDTSAIQYEDDFQMRAKYGDDFSIACCVSGMTTGKSMQFFGARANLAKALLYAINGGKDELSGVQVSTELEPISSGVLDFEDVWNRLDITLDWVAKTYIDALNIIHYMHDKYSYESLQMALHDLSVCRNMACGIAGLSVLVDSLSAIKYAQVTPVFDSRGIVSSYTTVGSYPSFGNNNDKVDLLANKVIELFLEKLKKQTTYRASTVTLSILTITSNVVYGKKTGDTPCGRKKGEPFAPGANPMHGREFSGPLHAMKSLTKLDYNLAEDGISYTFSIAPSSLGKDLEEQTTRLVSLLNIYFREGGQHINMNVFDKNLLLDALENPNKYPYLTLRVSGYAVRFNSLTKEQKEDVINRTIHT